MGNILEEEDWVQIPFITFPIELHAQLVDYFFVNNKMLCVFENFEVREIDINTNEVTKQFNLQEIEGFEISEEVEDDHVVTFKLDKDVMLLGVSLKSSVFVFEYNEEEEIPLSMIATIPSPNITSLVFVDYNLVMI